MPVQAKDILKNKKVTKTVDNSFFVDEPTPTTVVDESFFETEKKNTGTTSGFGLNPASPIPSPSISPLPEGNSFANTDIFNVAKNYSNPTIQDLDPIEKKKLNTQLPVLTSPESYTLAIKGIIEQRKNPAVKLTNAQTFIADDLEQNKQLFADMPYPERFKQQIIDGNDNDSNINIEKYYRQRNDQLDNQIINTKNQLYVSNVGVGGEFAGKSRSPNFDELQNKINELQSYKNALNKYSNILTAYQATRETPLPAEKTPTTMKDYYRSVGLKLQSINSPIVSETKKNNIESGVDATRHSELVDVENYRLESEGLNARQFTLNADLSLGKISNEDYIAQSNEIKNQAQQLFKLHPEAKKVAQSQALGQVLMQNRQTRNEIIGGLSGGTGINPISLWENVVNYGFSEDEIRRAARQLGLTEDEIKTQINNKDDIPGTSFLANVYNKFIVQSGENLVSPILSLLEKGRLRTDAEVEAEKYSKDQKFQLNAAQQFNQPEAILNVDPKSDEFLQEVANPNDGQHNWGYGTLNGFGDALGTLGQLWLATELTGGLGDVALGSTIGADVVGVTRTANALQEATALTTGQKALFGNVAGMMLSGYNENKAAAKLFIGEEQGGENAQNIYALTRGMETGLLFGMGFSPQTLVNRAFGRVENIAAAKTFAELIPKEGIEALDKNKWSEYLRNSLIARVGVEGLKENTKATTMMAIDQAVGIGTQAMFNPQSVDEKNLGHDLLNAGIHNFLTFAPISFFGAGVSAIKNPHIEQSILEREAIYRMGQDPLQYAAYVNAQVTDGIMLQGDANARIQLVNSMASIIKGNNIPAELSRSEKVEYANNLLYEQKLNNDIKGSVDEVIIKNKQKQIADLQARRQEILTNSTGIEKDANGNPVIKTPENEKNTNPEAITTEGQTIQGTTSKPGETPNAQETQNLITNAQTIISDKVSKGEVSDVYGEMIQKNPEHFLNFIADQALKRTSDGKLNPNEVKAHDINKEFGPEVVEVAKKLFPITNDQIVDYGKTVSSTVEPILKRINDADYINENELNTTADHLYDLLDKTEKSTLSDEAKSSIVNLVEPMITKIEGYEFRTKTETRTVTEANAAKIPPKVERKEIKPALEQSAGSEATVTLLDGSTKKGTLNIKSGQYVLDVPQGEQIVVGEKAITDRDLKLPDESKVSNPIGFDENGNVTSVTFETRNGNLVTIHDPEKALDMAIQLRADMIGEVPQELFDNTYSEIQKQISEERLVNQPTAEVTQPQSATLNIETNGKTKTETSQTKEADVLAGQQGATAPAEAPLNNKKESPPTENISNVSDKADSDATVLSFKGLQEVADEFGLANVTSRERKSDLQLLQDAKNTITKWVNEGTYGRNIENLVKSAEGMEVLNDEQRIIVQQHLANIRNEANIAREKFGINSKEFNDALLELKRINRAGILTRQAAGAALRIGDISSIARYDVPDMMAAKMEALNVDTLTEAQKTEIERQSKEIEARVKTAEDKVAAYEAEIAKYKAQEQLNNISRKSASNSSKPKTKTHEDYVKERQSLRDKLRQQKENHLQFLKEKGIQQQGFGGFVLTGEMVKTIGEIIKSHVDEVGNKLTEVTKRTFEDVKDLFEGVTEKDIHDVIAGKYNEKQKTKSQLQIDLKDIQDEAKLINKLESLEKREIPKTEKAKIERNQQIKDLQDKIKGHDITKLNDIKERNRIAESKIREKINKGEFKKEEKPAFLDNQEMRKRFPKQYKEALDAIIARDNAKHDFEVALLKDAQSKRNRSQKAYDLVKDIIGTSKALRAGIDFSALLFKI